MASAQVNTPLGAACENDDQCSSGQLCVRSHCTDIAKDMAECSIMRVHFDFNKSELLDQEKPLLQRAVRCIKAEHGVHFLITGNADERGTEEYNLALGDRRANAVAKYLERQGINKDQLSTVSYGKNQPLCTEHDEKCWTVNRRSAVKPQ
jgi:peptidoglycan-associated lipoprotein